MALGLSRENGSEARRHPQYAYALEVSLQVDSVKQFLFLDTVSAQEEHDTLLLSVAHTRECCQTPIVFLRAITHLLTCVTLVNLN